MQTRRKFLGDCVLTAVAVSLGSAVTRAGNPAGWSVVPEEPGLAEFARLVNTFFRVQAGFNTVRLLLVEATPSSPAGADAADAGNEKFSLRFRGPAQQPLLQDTYRFDHARLGRLSIFIVPAGWWGTSHRYYEAVFNRPLNPELLAAQLALAPRRVQT
jgi:hypothetical protein